MNVSLAEFMACPHNLAINRQTRMLANLSLVGCYDKSFMSASERDKVMLQSAKDNLRDMSFFGLTEYQVETQYLFQKTFNLDFQEDFEQKANTHAAKQLLKPSIRSEILKLNHLDIALYQYAKDLFLQRVKHHRDLEKNLAINKV